MIRHIFKLIWNRKRTNFLMVLEIFVSFIVLFAVVGVGVYTMDNWRRPIGFSYDRVWDVSIDMKQVNDDDFTQQQAETVRQVMLAFREFPEIEQTAGTMLAPYEFGSSSSSYRWHNRTIEFGVTEVTDGFGDLLGLKIVEGRWFGPEDRGQQFSPVVINRAMREELFGVRPGDRPDHRSRPRARRGTAKAAPGEPAAPPEKPRRIVGVVEAYREDGEFDGTRNYVIYRKDLDVFDAADRRNRPPRNMLIKVRQGTTADLQERLIRAAAGGGAVVVVRGDAACRHAEQRHSVRARAARRRRTGRRVPDVDGGAGPARRPVAERDAADA